MADPIQVSPSDLDVWTRTLLGECRGEPLEGQQGVAWTIRTRATWDPPAWWGRTIAEVCMRPAQFSCWLTTDPNFPKINTWPVDDPEYQALMAVARAVAAGEVDDPTGGATHYERLGAGASWAKGREFSVILGSQAFYVIGPEG